ncbi:MAG TPA: hypothetical protein DIC35_00085 [Candidatus Moranbacteria bacterium]|nr:hypothetical protein [Candidatus Moranbacteria bacterium]
MKLAVLFWFYKEPEICKNRLQILKKYNPDLKIYGLYGGEKKEAEKYEELLGKYLDDFYVSPYEDSDWKWINGDLMILEWFENRGERLEWDSIAVAQWDMLVLDSIEKQFEGIKEGQIYLSGTKILDKETENSWTWTKPGSEERENYLKFLEYIKENYGYMGEIFCCLFIFQILPRVFFEKYLTVKNKEVGMLEYKVPMYAKIFEILFYEKDLGVFWSDRGKKIDELPLNAWPVEIKKEFIESENEKKNGYRLFHPYFKKWNL